MKNKYGEPVEGVTGSAIKTFIEKNKRKFKNRHKTVGASEVGTCVRRVYFVKRRSDDTGGIVEDQNFEEGWGAAARGNNFEDSLWVPAMRERFGDNLLYAGKQQKRFALGNLSATPDALLINQPRNLLAGLMVPDIGPSRCIVVDCKTLDPRIHLDEPKPEHQFQLHVQLGMFRELTKYRPEYGLVSYTNASFFDDGIEFVIKFNPDVFARAQRRANNIMAARSGHDLKPEGWIAGGKECDWCAYATMCQAMRGEVPDDSNKRPDPQLIAQLAELATTERKWDATASAAETQKREVQHEIKELLREKGLRRIDEEGVKITWSSVVGRPAYDMPKIKEAAAAAGVDLSAYERVGTPSDRLTISLARRDRLVKTNK